MLPQRYPFELKEVPLRSSSVYVPLSGVSVIAVIRRCDQSAVQQVFATVRMMTVS